MFRRCDARQARGRQPPHLGACKKLLPRVHRLSSLGGEAWQARYKGRHALLTDTSSSHFLTQRNGCSCSPPRECHSVAVHVGGCGWMVGCGCGCFIIFCSLTFSFSLCRVRLNIAPDQVRKREFPSPVVLMSGVLHVVIQSMQADCLASGTLVAVAACQQLYCT